MVWKGSFNIIYNITIRAIEGKLTILFWNYISVLLYITLKYTNIEKKGEKFVLKSCNEGQFRL